MQKCMNTRSEATEKCSVVAVDDEPIVHRMLAKFIDECDLPVGLIGTASSALQGIDLVRQLRPDILLLDIEMGTISGLELARRLEDCLDYQPYIIYLTAHRRFEFAQEAIRTGASDYLLKPILDEDLLAALRRAHNHIQAERVQHLEQEQLRTRLESVLPAILPNAAAPKETHRSAVCRAARDYIDEHYAEDLSLENVADHVCLSPGHLGSIFKAEYGLSFRAYLRSVRIARSKELMQDHTRNIGQIALEVGYNDVNYFSHAFLEETGMRPSEYRGSGRRWSK